MRNTILFITAGMMAIMVLGASVVIAQDQTGSEAQSTYAESAITTGNIDSTEVVPVNPEMNAETAEVKPGEPEEDSEGVSAGEPDESSGNSAEEEESASGDSQGTLLTEESFQIGDVPEEYLTPAQQQGTVERVRYEMLDEEGERVVKSVFVYLPAGYEESDRPYNTLYLLHPSGGSPKDYLDTNNITELQCLLDHMIEAEEIEPLIAAAPTYFSGDPFKEIMPLAFQVSETSSFPEELTDYIIPAVEEAYRTYADSVDEAGITASRDHRGVAGFSLGGTAAWNTFIQKMSAFRWFLPISEASWDDGEGGISGIWDSDLSAEVLYHAVGEQGYTADDFMLFVATGTEDTAFEIATEQMKSLLEYNDLFITGENTSCSMMIGGTHTKSVIYTYLYHILPALFR